jgi:hypothetical protein
MRQHTFTTEMRKALILSASFLAFLTACKDEGEVRPDFAENTNTSVFNDQISLESRTETSDSILADKISTGLVGAYKDSVFGSSYASMHLQPLMASNFLVFGEDDETLQTDSVVLSLKYGGFRGDTIAQTFEVFRIDEVLSTDNNYSSNYQVATLPNVLGSRTFIPNTRDDIFIKSPDANGNIDSVRLEPQLRIRLDNAFGDEILAQSGQTALATNDDFINFVKGLKVSPQATTLGDNEKAILYFAMADRDTKLTIYYTATDQEGNATKKTVDFPVNSSSVRFNTFSHDFSSGAINQSLQSNNADTLHSYVQAMSGARTVINFAALDSLQQKNIIVNKAELELPLINGSYADFGVAEKLVLAAQDANGELQFIPDFFEGTSYFGGEYDALTQSYKFNINRYVQSLINGTESKKELTVLISGSAVSAERAVLGAASNSNRRIKLNLYYSNTQ